MNEPSIDDLFLPLLDFIDAKKSVILTAIISEMQIDFPEVEKSALEHNIFFCLSKMLEAEVISLKDDNYILTKKGTKALRERPHQITLKEIEFYIEHHESYIGKPHIQDHPKSLIKTTIKATKESELFKMIVTIVGLLLLFYIGILRLGLNSIDRGSNILTKPFEEGMEETNKAIKKLEETP